MWAQEVIGVIADGFIGPKTIAAINASGAKDFDNFLERRRRYYSVEVKTSLRLTYLKGWLARVADLQKAAIEPTTNLMA